MDRVIRMKELASEAVTVIKEFLVETSSYEGNFLKEIQVSEDGSFITLKNNYHEELEYSISEVGYILNDNIQGFWRDRDEFLNKIEKEKVYIYNTFKVLSKEEFINYIGEVYYMENKYEELRHKLHIIGKKTEGL